jgi:hypothetical protein
MRVVRRRFDGGVRPVVVTRLAVSERQFQAKVEAYAKLCRWLTFHATISQFSTPGWPDLVLTLNGRLVIAELKAEKGRVSPAQRRWLEHLDLVPCAQVFVWRPSDWPAIERVLR